MHVCGYVCASVNIFILIMQVHRHVYLNTVKTDVCVDTQICVYHLSIYHMHAYAKGNNIKAQDIIGFLIF